MQPSQTEIHRKATITLLTAMACTELGLTIQQAAGGYNISG